jgi:hypothetical protein
MGAFASVGRSALYDQVERFCLFIGYPRSGSTLGGSLLDAHRHAMIAHEAGILDYVQAGLKRDPLFWFLMRKNRQFLEQGSTWEGYRYEVKRGWQGRCERMRVIGDKKAGVTTQRLSDDPSLLDRLRQRVRVPVRMIHVVRNPYDNITTIAKRDGLDLERAFQRYFRLVERNARIRALLDPGELLEYRHEDLISRPRDVLTTMCGFLGLDAPEEFLEGCAGILFESPRRSRHEAGWSRELVARVAERMAEFEFLEGYRFDDRC